MKLGRAVAGLALLGSVLTIATPALSGGPDYVAAVSWSGPYIGVNAGYGRGDNTASLAPSGDATSQGFWNPAFNAGAAPSAFKIDQDGFVGGGQIGFNWQSGSVVFGLEADIQGSTVDGSDNIATNVPGFVPGAFSSSQKLDWFGTVRGRLGFASDRFMVFVTGGLAYGEVNYALSFAFPGSNDFHSIAASRTETGWTVGAGIEWAIRANWTFKAEYLHIDLGDTTLTSIPAGRPANLATTLTARFENQYNIIRAGLNYKF